MVGKQTPRIQVEPKRTGSDGEGASMLMTAYGLTLDDWQKTVIDCWLGTDENGQYTVTSAGLCVPRQNGKNVVLEAREFYGLVINGEKILHTAHQVRTSKKSFRRLVAMFEDKRHPEIQALVKRIRYTNGEESIELTNGGSIEFSARSRQAARGFAGISLVVFDEGQELTDDQLEAIMATLAASESGYRQLIYTGTPPYPGCPGEIFKRRRDVCTKNPGLHDAWHEWSVEGQLEKIKLDDVQLWYDTNPALGIRLTEDFTAEEMRSMSPDGFLRERLGWWTPETEHEVQYAISRDAWEKCKSSELKPEGKTAFGVKFSPDGYEVTICGAVLPENGPARVSLLDQKTTGHGLQWLADFLNARYQSASCVVIDGTNGADLLIDKIAPIWKQKGSIMRPKYKQVIAAADVMLEAIATESLTWYEKQESLNDSAITATKRKIGGGYGFGGENSGPIEAASLALWGVKTSKRDPKRKMRIG